MAEARRVLVFNSGSSSLKFGLYAVRDEQARVLLDGEAEGIAKAGHLKVKDENGKEVISEPVNFEDAGAAVARIRALLAERGHGSPDAIGHRLVHGGPHLLQHKVLDDAVLRQLHQACSYAPLHLPAALAVVEQSRALFAGVPQVACLDTAFHAQLPDLARVLPLPHELEASGLRRYGFHGLSCESIVARLEPMPQRLIVAHLGSGASVTAVRDGHSADTSMGLTPAGGIVMATRSGDLDPGTLIWLGRERGLDYDGLETLVNRRSGMLGVSGLSGDMRELRQAAPADPRARLAIDMFCLSVAKQIAAHAAVLGGLDLLVFTGGIGEHDAQSRAEICSRLSWAGIALEEKVNQGGADLISPPGATCTVRVLVAQEDATIARHADRLLSETWKD
ncbi:MAG: acetate/propionate family kinase [Betaproteobacteria bacterium]|nr:acetate/propionate family kinase [Betaproteobacteria bacterium]